MTTLLKPGVILTFTFMIVGTGSPVHAQRRMGMMMTQQMGMNAGMNGMMFNPNLAPNLTPGMNWGLYGNLYGSRGTGYGGSGGGYGGGYGSYSSVNPTDYSRGDDSNSKPKKRKSRQTPPLLSPEEERERIHQLELAWSQGDLTEFETRSATALNVLLDDLRGLLSRGIPVSDVALDQETLSRVNVVVGHAYGNAGLFKNSGQLTWPPILLSPELRTERELINTLVPVVIEQARHGQVNDLPRLVAEVSKLRQKLNLRIADFPSTEYVRAKRFLTQMDDAIKILQQPDAGNYFNRFYAARGNTVAELVRYMSQLDMRFAPAVDGDAPAYHSLHRILADYDRAAHAQLVAKN